MRKFPTKPSRRFPVKSKPKPQTYITDIHRRSSNPRGGWQWDSCVSIGDRDTHDHITFQLTDGKLMVYMCISGTPTGGVEFGKFMEAFGGNKKG